MNMLRILDILVFALMALAAIALVPEAAMTVIYMTGLILSGVGAWLLHKDSQKPDRGRGKWGRITLLAGVVLMVLPTVFGAGSASIAGS